MKRSPAIVVMLLALPPLSHAQEAPSGSVTRQDMPRWSVGSGAAVRASEFAGEGTRTRAIPYVSYEGDRFYLRGATIGYRLVNRPGFSVNGFVAGRLDGIDADDFGVDELAERGVDRNLLGDRDDSADAGVAMVLRGALGEVELDARGDVTDASGGYQTSLEYRYPVPIGTTTVIGGVGATYLSSDMANYYYGTLDEEVARGVVDYKPDDVVVPYVTVTVFTSLGKNWLLSANAQYRSLPDELQDSPLVELGSDSNATFLMAVARRF